MTSKRLRYQGQTQLVSSKRWSLVPKTPMQSRSVMMKYVFLVGCPRSGTTWLQLLLSQHPAVSSCLETHLFSSFLAPMSSAWNRHRNSRQGVGLHAVLSEEEFTILLKNFAVYVLDKIGDGPVILEKTPNHIRVADLVLRVVPDAWIVHMIRDPRAVASSLMAAGRSWGSNWAPRSAAAGARLWAADVSAGRDIRNKTDRYLEVRYEDLLANGDINLRRIFSWLELEADLNLCRQAIDACRIDKLQAGLANRSWYSKIEPRKFYRKGAVDSWRGDLAPSEVRAIEYIAGDLMMELGYTPSTSQKKPLSMSVADAARAILRRCTTAGRRWRFWIEYCRGSALSL
jgi:Sulfotransferase family